ncbi:Rab family [Metschnikowia aff. pulcherrima]|uniref:Rab family n=2 Tax=Metschnikowia TaxID=27320 RepID=A0A4P6XQT7_9ASCO|nr:hypothetical protein HF325_000349 [Metschnikowia pulcherrima]QBM88428.1 Rab family [Metschnikowia aff. pulcherrima]
MPTLKLVLLGDSSVGKSSLVNRFALDSFDAHLPNTIGAAFISKEHTSNGRTAKFEIWDTAGQERYQSLTPMYYRNAKVALVCFDLSAKTLFSRAKFWAEQLRVLGPQDILVFVVGTKNDLVQEQESEENSDFLDLLAQVSVYCADNNLKFMRTSAKLGEGVRAIFDTVVDSLDEAFFMQPDMEVASSQENVLLRVHGSGSSCC